MQLSLIADGVLIAACLTTAIYCIVLSRRLRRLSDMDAGIGKQILRMNAVLEETKAAVSEMRATTKSASDDLTREIEAAKRQGAQLQSQIARAIKSGVGQHRSDVQPATQARFDAATAPVAAPTEGAMKQAETVDALVEAAQDLVETTNTDTVSEPVENETMDGAGAVVDFDSAADVNQDVLDDDLAEEESVPRDELAEASDHWPFDDGEEEAVSTEEPDDFEHESDGLVRAPVPSASMEESGLLRVERMVV